MAKARYRDGNEEVQTWSQGDVEASRKDIQANLAKQSEAVSKLRELVRLLEHRLDPIMLPASPRDSQINEDSPEQSLIANLIDDTTNQILFAAWDIESLLDRVQLG